MIIKIKSPNENLLDILHKNPNTDFGLYAKNLKNGVIVGNCIDKNNYEVVFQDSKYSYLPEDSNLIDFQSYCSPLAVLHICNEFFSPILRSKTEYNAAIIKWLNKTLQEIDNKECEIEIPTFYINSNWAKQDNFLLSNYFENVKVTHMLGKNYQLSVKGNSVFEAMNLLNLVSVFVHITNNYGVFTFIDDNFSEKYARILTNISNVPYFVFYLFIKRATKTEKQFQLIKPVFENYLKKQGIDAKLTYYPTHLARIHFIVDKIDMQFLILDVGCGEFIYYKKMMKLGFEKKYFAIDEDEKFLEMSKNIQERYHENNLEFHGNLETFESNYNNEKVTVLLTEVIEHNSIESAKTLINRILKYNINQLFITTPNKDFNSFYFEDEDEMRHDDHDFEMTNLEFIDFINSCEIGNYKVKFHQIGDLLNGKQPTQACIITQ